MLAGGSQLERRGDGATPRSDALERRQRPAASATRCGSGHACVRSRPECSCSRPATAIRRRTRHALRRTDRLRPHDARRSTPRPTTRISRAGRPPSPDRRGERRRRPTRARLAGGVGACRPATFALTWRRRRAQRSTLGGNVVHGPAADRRRARARVRRRAARDGPSRSPRRPASASSRSPPRSPIAWAARSCARRSPGDADDGSRVTVKAQGTFSAG